MKTKHRKNISVPVIKIKGDTPFPLTHSYSTERFILQLEKAVGDVVRSSTVDGNEAESVDGVKRRLRAPKSTWKSEVGISL